MKRTGSLGSTLNEIPQAFPSRKFVPPRRVNTIKISQPMQCAFAEDNQLADLPGDIMNQALAAGKDEHDESSYPRSFQLLSEVAISLLQQPSVTSPSFTALRTRPSQP